MRRIDRTTQFKRDFKRESKGRHRAVLETGFVAIVSALAADKDLPPAQRDHSLTGNWVDCRECHIKPDLLLIYRKWEEDRLQLIRLGSHSELGL